MLTIYSHNSSFKKKLTVVVVWLIALAFSTIFVRFVMYEEMPFLYKLIPLMLGLFMISGILLRCKIARGMSLLSLYILALYPLVFNFMFVWLTPDIKTSYMLLYSATDASVFSDIEALFTNIAWALLVLIPVYFLSNNKSMDLFYIESNPKEHVLYIVLAVLLIATYFYYGNVEFLERLSQPI